MMPVAELGGAQLPTDVVVKGDSWHVGFNLGLMWEPTETLRFGLSYRSQIGHNAEGEAKAEVYHPQLNQVVAQKFANDFKVRVTTPDTIMATATWEATQDLRLSGMVRWARWSNFDQLDIHALGNDSPNHYDWEDTWLFSVGADYRLNNEWTVRGGLAYETGAVGEAQNRPATIPDVDRVWFSLGGSYNYSKQIQFDFGATYLMGVGNMDLCYHGTNVKMGEYEHLDAFILGAQLQYRF
jgi:long-chain fatty acid transport protein